MRILALVLVLAFALAGCTGTSESSSSSNQAGTASGATAASGTSSQAGTASKAPTGSASASSSAASSSAPAANRAPAITAFKTNVSGGAAPLAVGFNFTASDPDGNPLTFTLTFDDGSDSVTGSLPAPTQSHTYAASGNFTATLVVSDGKAETSSTALVKITDSLPAGASYQEFASSFLVDNPACYSGEYDALPSNESPLPPTPVGPAGTAGAEFLNYAKLALLPGTIGQTFVATFLSGAFEDHVLFLDASEAVLEDVATGGLDDPDWVATGTVPAGAAFAVFFGCQNLAGEAVTYTAGSPP